jgi:hypothetical protein
MKLAPVARRVLPAAALCAATAGGISLAFVGNAGPAFAGNETAINVDVQNAQLTLQDKVNNACSYDVTSNLTLVNLTDAPLPINTVADTVSWQTAGSSGVVGSDKITVVHDAGLNSSVTLSPHQTKAFSGYVIQATIPCDTKTGDLEISITTPSGEGSGDADFIINGTPLPVGGAIGGLGAAAIMGGALLVMQRRSRKAQHARTVA